MSPEHDGTCSAIFLDAPANVAMRSYFKLGGKPLSNLLHEDLPIAFKHTKQTHIELDHCYSHLTKILNTLSDLLQLEERAQIETSGN